VAPSSTRTASSFGPNFSSTDAEATGPYSVTAASMASAYRRASWIAAVSVGVRVSELTVLANAVLTSAFGGVPFRLLGAMPLSLLENENHHQ
jgi:hypothetical protein